MAIAIAAIATKLKTGAGVEPLARGEAPTPLLDLVP